MRNEKPFAKAVEEFWVTRLKQQADQKARGRQDQGARGAVTGGKQMDGFIRAITAVLIENGVPPDCIYAANERILPGFYRPTKEWDLVVIRDGTLLAALELKSQVGPSFGNNFNNRTEEAIGVACDTWTAYREGAFGASPAPWLGYLFLLEDCPHSQRPVDVQEPHFLVFPEFKGASYAKRYEVFCRKLVLERQYTAACFLLTNRKKAHNLSANYTEPALDLSVEKFLGLLARHVRP